MTIHKQGHKIIAFTFVALLLLILIMNYIFSDQSIFHYVFYCICLIIFLTIILFFRYPKREIKFDYNNILSSADGRIVAIEEVEEDEYFKDKKIQVSVFMAMYVPHANWCPIGGMIKYIKYHPGSHFPAFMSKSSLQNEMITTVIENDKKQSVLIRQIAGILARRVVSYVNTGNEVKQGDEFGFIEFGSRVDLLLPLNVDIQVGLNQKVRGGETVIAKFK